MVVARHANAASFGVKRTVCTARNNQAELDIVRCVRE